MSSHPPRFSRARRHLGQIQKLMGLSYGLGLLYLLAANMFSVKVMQLLRRKAKVYIASRSRSKFEQFLSYLEPADANVLAHVEFLELDLSDMRSCIHAARRFTELEERLDILIENAALSVVVSNYTIRCTLQNTDWI